jgi:Holliday junction resolvase RusA-like endonuclease
MDHGAELLRLTCYGQPAGAGSKTAEVATRGRGGPPLRDANGRFVLRYRHASKFTAPWMEAVEREARIAWRGLEALCGPLWLELTCFEARPKAHFRTGRYSHLLRPDAPAYPDVTETHDSGKLRRAIEDSLTNAGVLSDDKRIVDGRDRKRYCDALHPEPKAVIRVGRMVHRTVEEAGLVSPDPAGQESLVAA